MAKYIAQPAEAAGTDTIAPSSEEKGPENASRRVITTGSLSELALHGGRESRSGREVFSAPFCAMSPSDFTQPANNYLNKLDDKANGKFLHSVVGNSRNRVTR